VKLFWTAEKLSNAAQYKAAEEAAQKEEKGVWKLGAVPVAPVKEVPVPEEEVEVKVEENRDGREKQTFNVAVTEIMTGTSFYYQIVGAPAEALSDMMELFQKQNWVEQSPYEPKKGELIAAQYALDDFWYRAKVLRAPKKVSPGDPTDPSQAERYQYFIEYIDYGNKESLGSDRIRRLTSAFDTHVLSRQAHEGKLAFIKSPTLDEEFGRDAATAFKEMVWKKTLLATVEEKAYQDKPIQLSLGDTQTRTPINFIMVKSGLARVERRRRQGKYYERLQQEEHKAKATRLCIWQYGDLPDSDDEREENRLRNNK